MHENIEKINFIKTVFVYININRDTNTIFIKLIFSMFSCILSFVDMPMVLSTYLLRFGTQVPVGNATNSLKDHSL